MLGSHNDIHHLYARYSDHPIKNRQNASKGNKEGRHKKNNQFHGGHVPKYIPPSSALLGDKKVKSI